MTVQHLLPSNSTPIERAVSAAVDRNETLGSPIDAIAGQKFLRPLTGGWAPWLITEYGLGPISRYFETPEEAIDDGIAWQRLRGTPAGLFAALAWIGYATPALEDDKRGRREWQRYQVAMGEVPAGGEEDPRLYDAEYLAGLSDPARALFWRGFAGYDVRALEYGQHRWGGAIWGDDSGVRMPNGETLWSHGEAYDVAVSLTDDQRAEISADVTTGSSIGWDAIPWSTPGVSWSGVSDPKAYKAFLLARLPAYLGFFDADDQPIGYRRVYGAVDVTAEFPPVVDTAYVRFTARTGFGEGFGSVAASVALLFHARPADATRPGRLWLEPGEIAFDPGYDAENLQTNLIALPLTFRRTVRERVTVTVEV